MPVISIPRILREKLSDEGADALVEIINISDEKVKGDVIEIVEERFERRLAHLESRIIKWMFIFWIGQFTSIVGVLTAILFAFFKR